MINILSYIGMSFQSEVCMWTLLGMLRTIFDATLFKVNANLKQVWQMDMPRELSLPLQRVLRTMISGVMLVQCFTVYVYLATYIVLLYPVFLEERPTLILPWLLLAAIRKLLCELISLALGLGTCVLLGPARPPCIKFVIIKLASIMPAFYMWTLVFSYYHTLKIASAFKTFSSAIPVNDNDYGLELAVRRRRTKSLQGEDQLRKKLVASLYGDRSHIRDSVSHSMKNISTLHSDDISNEDLNVGMGAIQPLSITSHGTMADISAYDDCFGTEVVLPRDTDRIMEQFVLMLLRIASYLKKDATEQRTIFNSSSQAVLPKDDEVRCSTINNEDLDTPLLVGSSKGKLASYLRDYPQIFRKKMSDIHAPLSPSERNVNNNTDSPNSTSSKNKKNIDKNTQSSLAHEKEIKLTESMESVLNRLKIRTALYENNKENHDKLSMKSSKVALKLTDSTRKQDNRSKELKWINSKDRKQHVNRNQKSNKN